VPALRAAVPNRIPTRIIGADQVQRELTQQTEEELQQPLADISRAADLGDPELTRDAVIIARFLVKNNLLGASSVGALGLNTMDNEAAANQHLSLTVQQRNALDNLIKVGLRPFPWTASLTLMVM
jgi:hypothetical protein